MEVASTLAWFHPSCGSDEVWVLVKENGTLVGEHGTTMMFPFSDAAVRWVQMKEGREAPWGDEEWPEPMTVAEYERRVERSLANNPKAG